MPDNDDRDDETPYHVPLGDLEGRHGYALQRGEDDDEIDPGAPVAYVAEPMKERPSALTIEGMIRGIGDAAYGAAKQGGQAKFTMRVVAAMLVLPSVIILLGRAAGWL